MVRWKRNTVAVSAKAEIKILTLTSFGHGFAHTRAELDLVHGRVYVGYLRGAAQRQLAVRVMEGLKGEADLAPLRPVDLVLLVLLPLSSRGRLHLREIKRERCEKSSGAPVRIASRKKKGALYRGVELKSA